MTVAYLETGVLYCDDNLHRLSQFPSESVDLVYLDPPFFSNRIYEVIWGDEAEVRSFEDRWEGGIQVYIEWMRERMLELHRILKPTGSLYLHCDPTASHYLKVMTDEIFGRERFRNEITWQRTGAHNDAKHFGRVTDSILFYTRTNRYTFHQQFTAYDPAYVQERYRYVDPDGRRYWRNTMTAAEPRVNPKRTFRSKAMLPPPGTHWRFLQTEIDRLEAKGGIYYSSTGMPYVKSYLDERRGRPVQNLWTDIVMSKSGNERLGYPTQKPIALLERILASSSDPGDIVLDPFCGCGTTLAAAQPMGRHWIGIDISPTAIGLMKWRLDRLGAMGTKLVGMPVTVAQLRDLKPFEFQNWVIQRLHGTHAPRKVGDMGIDGYSFMLHEPIQVKQSDSVGRPVVDAFQTAVERSGKAKGYIVAFSFTRGAHEEAARVKVQRGMDIILLPVSSILGGTDIVTPEPGLLMTDLPLPEARGPDARPSVEELIASEHSRRGLAMAAEEPAEYA